MTNLDALRRKVSGTLVIAARKWRRTSHGVLSAFNVSEACATPLLTASRLGEAVRQVTLADYIGIEGPSLVRLLDQLCAAGLMRRDEDPADRRAKTVVLTQEGRSVTQKMEDELVTLRAQALKGISRSDLEATLRVLTAFTANSPEESQAANAASAARAATTARAANAANAASRAEPAKSTRPVKAQRAKPRRAALKVRRNAR
ncbi:MarR family winged helix-turn-helix transcriptional regulator [Burkholderia sp. WSM2230]|uniref:MarR family winged helix-turn-helix transcriptional regulator n=1 Tax=Burkholderia sp. WSM2230 TaxID=944435 RepID=UPI00040821DD|nr:MarR family transcriptional regulator [Burkholderia sp. WSM2230]